MSLAPPPTIVVQNQPSLGRKWAVRLLTAVLGLSLLLNFSLYAAWRDYFADDDQPKEKYYQGSTTARDKIVVLEAVGTIMPPLTGRLIKQIEKAGDDKNVKGVLLAIDSPGGLVTDSHQIYHKLQKLREKKPVYVQMRRIAASGGYYIAMGCGEAGKIYAEPTTWTGSIGVIIPRYDASGLSEKVGVKSDPLKTGEFKDALSPFRPLTDRERAVWGDILAQSFDQFVDVIQLNRGPLDRDGVVKLATGQIYTAKDAVANGMIDGIAFEEETIEQLKKDLKLDAAKIVKYESPISLADLIMLGQHSKAAAPEWQAFLDASVPKAHYLCSWLPSLPQ